MNVKTNSGHWNICRNIGQEWCLCPFEWGVDQWITIESSAGKLVLCSVSVVTEGSDPNEVGSLIRTPIVKEEMQSVTTGKDLHE